MTCALCGEPAVTVVDGEKLCERCADVAASWLQKHGQAVQKAPAVAVPVRIGPRRCSRCQCEDQALTRDGQQDFQGRPILEHSVVDEIRYIKDAKQITAWHRSRGWSWRPHLGRPAMTRLTCRTCLNEASILQKDIERKKRAEMRSANTESYYLNVCEGS